MRRWASIALACLLLGGNGIPLQAEEEQVSLSVHSSLDAAVPCIEAAYGLFQDEAASIPILDEEGKQIIYSTDAKGEGKYAMPQQPFYLKLITPAKGFYGDTRSIAGAASLQLSLAPVRFSFTCGQRIPEMALRKEDGTVIPCTQAEAGKTYTAFEEKTEGYQIALPVQVKIPEVQDATKDPLPVKTEEAVYGKAMVHFAAKGKEIDGISYEIYSDEAGREKKQDLQGRGTYCSKEDKEEIPLLPGQYYLKVTDLPATYALEKNMIPFTVEKEKDTEVSLALRPMKLKINVIDRQDSHPVQAEVVCMHDNAKAGQEDTDFLVERQQTYQIQVKVKDSGYFNIPSETVAIPSDAADTVTKTITAVPYTIHVRGLDKETGQDVAMKYEIRDLQGALVNTVPAGETVIFHETACDGGYFAGEDVTLAIPAYSPEPQTYEVEFYHSPYVVSQLSAPSGVRVSLFKDAACTQTALDCYGKAAVGVTGANGTVSFAMSNGSYYAKQTGMCEGYYPSEEVLALHCQRAEGPLIQRAFTDQRVALLVQSSSGDAFLPGVSYHMEENGEVITSFTGNGEDTMEQGLTAGHTYDVVVDQVDGQYLYTERKTITLPETAGPATVQFSFEPYVSLKLSTQAKTEIRGALYQDEACTEKASDIYGHCCDLILTAYGTSRKLAPGTYWFCNEATPHYYRKVTKIELDGKESAVQQKIDLDAADVRIEFMNQENKGDVMALADETGKLIKTWNADGEAKEIENEKLEPGRTYVIEDKDTGDKTTFTLPQSPSSEQPVVTMAPEKESEHPLAQEKSIPGAVWMAAGTLLLVVGGAGSIYLHRHRM